MGEKEQMKLELEKLQQRLVNVQEELEEKRKLNQSQVILNANRGMVLHTDLEDHQFYVCPNVIHTLGLGPTGTGKSQMLVFPTMEVISRPSFPSIEQLKKIKPLKKLLNKLKIYKRV